VRALITGASRGIGRATALRLAAPGADLRLHYHQHREEAEAVAREAAQKGARPTIEAADLSRPSDVTALAARVRASWESLDALVLNAGAYPRGSFRTLSDAEVKQCFQLNVFGPISLTRDLLPLLDRSSDGRIVFVSSVLATTGSTHGAHYAAAKAALVGLARSLARELAPRIKVNVVAPGPIDTAILAGDTPERRTERERAIPVGRIGRPEEVAEAVAFLLGPGGAFMTGTTLHVNGGASFA